MEKLVRDKMPQIAEANGRPMKYRVSNDHHESIMFLRAKLVEETKELDLAIARYEEHYFGLADSNDMQKWNVQSQLMREVKDEMADVQEVFDMLALQLGVDPQDIEHQRKSKNLWKGAFWNQIIWDGNDGK
jgi:predicted house-cleaning noncanonical NTP pyrophosphatase (MazG superfamily)